MSAGKSSPADKERPTKPRAKPPPEAQRALAEADARRAKAGAGAKQRQNEIGGRDGPEPTRYGDWEKDGITSDF